MVFASVMVASEPPRTPNVRKQCIYWSAYSLIGVLSISVFLTIVLYPKMLKTSDDLKPTQDVFVSCVHDIPNCSNRALHSIDRNVNGSHFLEMLKVQTDEPWTNCVTNIPEDLYTRLLNCQCTSEQIRFITNYTLGALFPSGDGINWQLSRDISSSFCLRNSNSNVENVTFIVWSLCLSTLLHCPVV